MMPLCYADPGEESVIRKIGGSPEVKRHLENLGFAVGGKGTPVKWLVSSKAAYADVADVLANQQVKVVDQCEVEHRNYGKQIWAVIENSAGDRFLLCTSYYSNTGVCDLFTADYIATNERGIASSFNHGDYLLEDAHARSG